MVLFDLGGLNHRLSYLICLATISGVTYSIVWMYNLLQGESRGNVNFSVILACLSRVIYCLPSQN